MRIIVPISYSPWPLMNINKTYFLKYFSKKYDVTVYFMYGFESIIKQKLGFIHGEWIQEGLHFKIAPRPYLVHDAFTLPLAYISLNLENADICWAHDPITAALYFKAPIVVDYDDPLSQTFPIYSVVERIAFKKQNVKFVVTPTEKLKKYLVKKVGVPPNKIRVVPFGVDIELFKPTPFPETPTVLYCGVLDKWKIQILLDAMEIVWKKRENIRLILVGHADSHILSFASRHKSRVKLYGYVNHNVLPMIFAHSTIGTYPASKSFGGRFSMKLLEYMASGKPIIATDVDEAFLVEEAQSGIIVPRNPKEFANAIIKLVDNENLLRRFGENGRKFAEKYSSDEVAKQYIKIFEDILDY